MIPVGFNLVQSFTFRLAVLAAGIFAGLTALLMGLGYWATVHRPLAGVRTQVEAETFDIARLAGPNISMETLSDRLDHMATDQSGRTFFYLLVSPQGVRRVGNLPLAPEVFDDSEWQRVEFEGVHGEHEGLFKRVEFVDGGLLFIGRDTEDLDEREELFTQTLPWAVVASTLFGLLGGLMLSVAVGRRIAAIDRAARDVMRGDLSRRLPIRGTSDDFDQLSALLNAMLDRIEQLLVSVSSVSDNIAHEMRTPLARLLADVERLDVALSVDDRAATNDQIDHVRLAAEQMQTIFDALLRIARIEAGREAPSFRPVPLSDIVADAIETYSPAAEMKDVRFIDESVSTHQANAWGDPDLLFQAVCNLIDNAVKFSPAGHVVRLELKNADSGHILTLQNSSSTLCTADRSRLGERFFRTFAAEDRQPGNGLGLSLVKAIAQLHGGSVEFPRGDTTFTVRLYLPSPLRQIRCVYTRNNRTGFRAL